MDKNFLLVNYKIVVWNMISSIDGFEGSLEEVKKKINKETNYFKKKTFDGHKIKYCIDKESYMNLKDDELFIDKEILIFQDIDDYDYALSIRKLDMMDELGL